MLFPVKVTVKEKLLTCHWSGPGLDGCWRVCHFCVDSENLNSTLKSISNKQVYKSCRQFINILDFNPAGWMGQADLSHNWVIDKPTFTLMT